MQKILSHLALGLFFAASLHADDSTSPLTIEMSDPNVRITIPGMGGIEMDVHPMNEDKPDFRLRGNAGTTVVAVITPKISTEVSPMSCAIAIANVVLAQQAVSRDQMFLGRTDEHTFLIIYGLPLEQSVLLNTHIVSSDASTKCIEAQVSKISTSDADIEPWFNGFAESSIERL